MISSHVGVRGNLFKTSSIISRILFYVSTSGRNPSFSGTLPSHTYESSRAICRVNISFALVNFKPYQPTPCPVLREAHFFLKCLLVYPSSGCLRLSLTERIKLSFPTKTRERLNVCLSGVGQCLFPCCKTEAANAIPRQYNLDLRFSDKFHLLGEKQGISL